LTRAYDLRAVIGAFVQRVVNSLGHQVGKRFTVVA